MTSRTWRVVVSSLTIPPTRTLYRDFPLRPMAELWRSWCEDNLPCSADVEEIRRD